MAFVRVATVLALVVASSHAGDLLQEPLRVSCSTKEGVELVVKQARINVGGQVEFNTRAYHYNGIPMVPGPTITALPGKRCKITIINELPNDRTSICATNIIHAMNSYMCADCTNLHTHGNSALAVGCVSARAARFNTWYVRTVQVCMCPPSKTTSPSGSSPARRMSMCMTFRTTT